MGSKSMRFIGAIALGIVAGCASPRTDAPFAKYDDVKEVQTFELARTSQSWDGVGELDHFSCRVAALDFLFSPENPARTGSCLGKPQPDIPCGS